MQKGLHLIHVLDLLTIRPKNNQRLKQSTSMNVNGYMDKIFSIASS